MSYREKLKPESVGPGIIASEPDPRLRHDSSSISSGSSTPVSSPLKMSTGTPEEPWKREVNELRGRLCLLQTRIQEKEKSDAEIIKSSTDELLQSQVARENSEAAAVEIQKEMLKLRDRMDLLDGRMNLMYRELESLISWTGFRNDETNSFRNFQERRNVQQHHQRLRKTGKAGVQVILVEDNAQGDFWEPPDMGYDEEAAESGDDESSDVLLPKSSIANATIKVEPSERNQRFSTKYILPELRDSLSRSNSADLQQDKSGIAPIKDVTFERNPATNKYPCLACPKEFINKKDVARHYRIHTGEKPFSCSICQMKFVRKDTLNQHISKRHEGQSAEVVVDPLLTDRKFPVTDFGSNLNAQADDDNGNQQFDPDFDCNSLREIPPPQKRGRGRPRKYPVFEVPEKPKEPAPKRKRPDLEVQKIEDARLTEVDLYSLERNPTTNKFDCTACSKPFCNRRDMIRHYRLHTGEKPYSCPHCEKSFSRKDKLVGHERKEHGKGGVIIQSKKKFERLTFPCDKCPEVSPNRRQAARHAARHASPLVRHKCHICESGFFKKEKLAHHLRSIHGEKVEGEPEPPREVVEKVIYNCSQCRKKFSQKKFFDRHVNSCKGLRSFPCPECERIFTQNSTLIQHRAAVHRGIKRFLCAEYGKGFYTSGNYKKHMRSHRNERPYQCQLCERAFVGLSDLRNHEAIHRGIRKHQCPDCDLKFFRRYTLIRHRRVHTGEKPYMCDICGASFTQCGTLKKHKDNHHIDGHLKQSRPRIKGKKYRVRPQPDFPAFSNDHDLSHEGTHSGSNIDDSDYVGTLPSHSHHHLPMPTNPPSFQITKYPQAPQPDQPHYGTVDFVSIFSQGFGGF